MNAKNETPFAADLAAGKSRWFGNDDIATSPHSFWTGPELHTRHIAQFQAVLFLLQRLVEEEKVQLLFLNAKSKNGYFLAYRFTSDENYALHRDEVVNTGSSLGRGGFRPWQKGSDDYEEFVA
jgi:hypothetical protein